MPGRTDIRANDDRYLVRHVVDGEELVNERNQMRFGLSEGHASSFAPRRAAANPPWSAV
jgi:hypothetical protein